MEDPLDHLDEFDRLCSLTKINGVSEDGFKLRLFPFSLGDKAHLWEKNLPHGSITSWDGCKKAFLAKFFSNARTAKLRNEISGFAQKNAETFCEAWERFKSYTSQCPHHGFSNESLLSTLYRGVLPKIRMLLDTASNGNFLNKDVEEGWELVENLAQSDGNYAEDYDRSYRGSSDSENKKKIQALHDKIDMLILSQQKQIHYVCEEEQSQVHVGESDQLEEISYIQNQGGYNKGFVNYKANPNLSYRSTNVANPQDQVYPPQQQQHQNKHFVPYNQNQGYAPNPQYQNGYQQQTLNAPPGFANQEPDMKAMLQQLLQSQATSTMEVTKKFAELKNHIDYSYNDLNSKIETLHSKIKFMENKTASTSLTKPIGQLPGKSIQNPKDIAHVNAIRLNYTNHTLTGDSEDQVGEDIFQNEDQEDQVDILTRSADRVNTPNNETEAKEDKLEGRTRSTNRVKDTPAEKFGLLPPSYKPPHLRLTKEAVMEKINKIIEEQDKERKKFIQKLRQECSAILQGTVPPLIVKKKLGDPGFFTLPCSLGPLTFKDCLCDLGASVNLMPLSVANELGFTHYKSSFLTLVLADGTSRRPRGILEDLPVRIGIVEVPTDFVVLDIDGEQKEHLILGRPFLASAEALIDVKNGKIDLDLGGGCKMMFDIKDPMKKLTIEDQSFSIEEQNQHIGQLQEDYPPDECEVCLQEETVENNLADHSREHAEFGDPPYETITLISRTGIEFTESGRRVKPRVADQA
ncbi:hypothetical protein V5N11_010476 [Cardamine amara subsp. amara]|uniref:Retrotransposon gag domain-containing protein n=1 Tax=Cardamine amara subsp. amara TaxID=228776 RepID=A0ABD1APY6_CARAN